MTTSRTKFLAGSLPVLLAACGGAAQVHSGYPSGEQEPWSSPTKLKLNDNNEASTEGNVSFPKRARAKWYVLELPAAGSLNVKLKMSALSTGADVGFEILDAGYNVNAGPLDDNDVGQEEKVRKVKEARAGRTYIHVYAMQRNDQADYKLRVRYEPKVTARAPAVASSDPSDGKSQFPWTVPNLPQLAQVPASEHHGGGKPAKEETPAETPTPQVESDPAKEGTRVGGSIIEFGTSGSGVKIVINKGSDAGVDVGWTGYVVDKKGNSLKNGAFKIKKVKNDEAEGVVGLHLDDIQANRSVVLKPPK